MEKSVSPALTVYQPPAAAPSAEGSCCEAVSAAGGVIGSVGARPVGVGSSGIQPQQADSSNTPAAIMHRPLA